MLHAIVAREGIIRWSVTTHGNYQRTVPAAETDHPELTIVRLRTAGEVERWFSGPLSASLHA